MNWIQVCYKQCAEYKYRYAFVIMVIKLSWITINNKCQYNHKIYPKNKTNINYV